MDRNRLLRILVTVSAIVLAVLPAAVVFGLGWLRIGHPSVPAGGTAPVDGTPLEAWALFALFYLAWMFGLMVLMIVVFDRLGHHWRSWDRAPRKDKKRRLRLSAGLSFLAGQQKARSQASIDAARRRAAAEAARKKAASAAMRDSARARAAGPGASAGRPAAGSGNGSGGGSAGRHGGAAPGAGRGGGA